MITECSYNGIATASTIVHVSIPIVHISGNTTVPSVVLTSYAALETPSSIFSTIVMIALNSPDEIVAWTSEQ